eukprot:gene4213-3045_t
MLQVPQACNASPLYMLTTPGGSVPATPQRIKPTRPSPLGTGPLSRNGEKTVRKLDPGI